LEDFGGVVTRPFYYRLQKREPFEDFKS
jgi:hypothetical protein